MKYTSEYIMKLQIDQHKTLINDLNDLTYDPRDKHNHYLTTIVET